MINKVEHQNSHFDTISSEYYKARQGKNHLKYKDLLFNEVLKTVKFNKKASVLEPMCGYAEGRNIIRKYVCKDIDYVGFDFNEVLISKVQEESNDILIYKQDVTKFTADEKKYDIIILLGGLHHVPDYAENVCREIEKALKEDGLFINFEPTNNNFIISFVRNLIYKKNHIFDEVTERAFSFNELNDMYKTSGFKIKKQYNVGLLAYVLYYNPDAFPLLNLGNEKLVEKIFKIDRIFYENFIGRFLSFCSFSILEKRK